MDRSSANQPQISNDLLEAVLDVWQQAGRQHLIPISGRSMLPLIQDGDRVLVAHGGAGLRRGDLVVFRKKGILVAHRVLRIDSRTTEQIFVTKGDNTLLFDMPVPAREIVGQVLAINRGGQSMPLDTPAWRAMGWLIAVGTLPLAALYGWGRNLKHNLWGPQPRRLSTFLRRSVLAFVSVAVKAIGGVIGRWQK